MTQSASNLYVDAQRRFIHAVRGEDTARPVPYCPDWTIHDLLSHQLHQLAGMSDGTFPVSDAMNALTNPDPEARRRALAGQNAWIDTGVAKLRSRSSMQIVDAWTELTNSAPADALRGLVPDLAVHLLDLDAATGRETSGIDALIAEALEFWAFVASTRIANLGLGGLTLATPDGRTFGAGDGVPVVTGSLRDLLLATTARLSLHEATTRLGLPDHVVVVENAALYGWRAASSH
jgi:uncharacterized protein (TIGR03083 family)